MDSLITDISPNACNRCRLPDSLVLVANGKNGKSHLAAVWPSERNIEIETEIWDSETKQQSS